VRLGVHLPQFRRPTTGTSIAAFARAAEGAGADDLWVSDHVALDPESRHPPAYFHDALTVLTWAAAATERVGLGTSVLVAPYRNPVVLAKALASLDDLTGGRVIAGLASGWLAPEFAALGVPYRDRGRRTDETIAICRALWSGATDYVLAGRVVSATGIAPLPARQGGPPIWIGGNSDAGLRRAATLGDGWHTTIADPATLLGRLATLERLLEAAGRDRARFVVSVRVRTTARELETLAPRLAALGVDHVLVDHRDIVPRDLAPELERLRRIVRDSAPVPGPPGIDRR
jgi:probable F420-dependent oxidoreductase